MPKDPHITGGIRHDWATIEHEYLTDPDATLRKLADKYGVSRNAIYKKSKAEGWFATRKKTQAKAVAKAVAKTTDKMAAELSEEADFLKLLKGHAGKMLNDTQQYQRHLVETKAIDEDGSMIITTEEKLFDKFDSKAMKDTMQILTMMESMTRSLYNIQKAERIERTQIERERLELEKERLALERERNALRSGNIGTDNDKQYGVVLMPEVINDGN